MTPNSWRPLWARAARQIIGGRLPSTLVLWTGASRLDGTPIMVVASRINAPSKNGKTGDMVQVSIMRRDLSPIDAWKAGADGAVCPAACVHRSKARGGRGTCYVNKARLGSTWRAACRLADAGKVGMPVGLFTGAVVRLGMEGDPSAVPFTAWQEILIGAKRHTGYTADWRRLPREWSALFMASCASPADVADAIAAGWRPFTASASSADDAAYAAAGLKVCASDSVGLSCVRCGGCDGTSRGAKRAGYYLAQHGSLGAAARKKNDACPAASAIVDRIAAARAAR
jgi:hypothetical protein